MQALSKSHTNPNLVVTMRVKTLSLDESEGGTKLFNLTLGQILRENDVNS